MYLIVSLRYNACVKYKINEVRKLYRLAPSTLRYWRRRLDRQFKQRQEGVCYAEVVALGLIHHLVQKFNFRVHELESVYHDLIHMALLRNLPTLQRSWLLVSADGHQVKLIPRTDSLEAYALDWRIIDAGHFLNQLDERLKSSEDIEPHLAEARRRRSNPAPISDL